MAFNDDKYTLSFADAQDRSHVLYFDLDGYTGGATALKPGPDPVVYRFGNPRDDEYRTLNPTALDIQVIVSDTTVFNDIAGDTSRSWRVRWEIDASEVWRGYLITDQIEQPFDLPSVLRMTAVCGLKELDSFEWDTATVRNTFMAHIADILTDLTGIGLNIGAYANWHAHDGGTAVSGNSFSTYSFDSAAMRDPLDADSSAKSSVALEQAVGRFGAKMCQADGKWRIFQRSGLSSDYSMDVYNTSGGDTGSNDSITGYAITNSDIYSDGVESRATAYQSVPIGYYHYPEGTGFFLNGDFSKAAATVPDNWTKVGTGNVVRAAILAQYYVVDLASGYAVAIDDKAHSGTNYGDDAVDDATLGIYQDSAFDARSTSHAMSLSFRARIIGNDASTSQTFFYSIWIDGDAGTDYYWDAADGAWNSAGGGARTNPTSGSKNPRSAPADASWHDFFVETADLPDTGTLRLYLWTVVSSNAKSTAIQYTDVKFEYLTSDRGERVKTTTTLSNDLQSTGEFRSESFYFIGQGPSDNHVGRITYGVDTAENWKPGDYATSEAVYSGGKTLSYVHAEDILDHRSNDIPRIATTFRTLSGQYWPHRPLEYGGSNYSCTYLSYNAARDEYTGEWVALTTGGVTPTEEEEYSDDDIRPPDFGKPIHSEPVGEMKFLPDVAKRDGKMWFNTAGGRTGLFPRSARIASDNSQVLANNFITGVIELGTGASIRLPGAESSTAGTYIDDEVLRVRIGATTFGELYSEGVRATNGTTSNILFASNGASFTDSTGATLWINDQINGVAGDLTVGAAGSADFTIYGSAGTPGVTSNFISLPNSGDVTVAFNGDLTLNKLDGAAPTWTWPTADASATGQPLVSDGAGALSFAASLGETAGGTGLTSYTTGDILYASGANTLAKLPIGSNGSVLTVSGGAPAWAASGGTTQNLFETVAADSGTNAVADSATDTLTIAGGTNIATVGDSGTDTITVNFDGTLPISSGGTNATTASNARTQLGLQIGSDVQAWSSKLDDVAAFTNSGDDKLVAVLQTPTSGIDTIGLATSLQISAGSLGVVESNVDHDSLQNYVADEHIDWTSTSSNFSTSGTLAAGRPTFTINGVGEAVTDSTEALRLLNTTAAISGGTQQYSPALVLSGQYYDIGAGASNDVSYRMYVTAANDAGGDWVLEGQSGGAYAQVARFTESGALTIANAFTLPSSDGSSDQVLITNGSGAVSWGGVINAITTLSTSGLAGGVTSGTAALTVDISGLTAGTSADFFGGELMFETLGGNLRKIDPSNIDVGDFNNDSTYQPIDGLLTSLSNLSDPNVDRILFWDDGAGKFEWLTVGNGLDLTTTTLTHDSSVTAGTAGYGGDTDTLTIVTGDGRTVQILCEDVT